MDMTPAWYGKLPALGDFASRRLPPAFLADWDAWLQRGMAYSQQHLGSDWLDTYLTSNVWSFILAPNTIDSSTWAGIVLPSVDRVGRYFPLTICASLADFSFEPHSIAALEEWVNQLEAAARAGLDANASIDSFEAVLANCPAPPAAVSSPSLLRAEMGAAAFAHALSQRAAFERIETGPNVGLEALTRLAGGHLMGQLFGGYSLWWCHNEANALGGFVCQGMPSPSVFARMLQYTPEQS
ncbi:MAG: type secretion-associated protein [Rhodocyclales bacterium]|nr:type secretion-associated protein [Rhodocyclales bacterium]